MINLMEPAGQMDSRSTTTAWGLTCSDLSTCQSRNDSSSWTTQLPLQGARRAQPPELRRACGSWWLRPRPGPRPWCPRRSERRPAVSPSGVALGARTCVTCWLATRLGACRAACRGARKLSSWVTGFDDTTGLGCAGVPRHHVRSRGAVRWTGL